MAVSLEQLRPSSQPYVRYPNNMMQVIVIIAQLYIVGNDNGNEVPNTYTVLLREVRKCD
jgi:hypothetical protein